MGHNTCKSMGRVLCVVRRQSLDFLDFAFKHTCCQSQTSGLTVRPDAARRPCKAKEQQLGKFFTATRYCYYLFFST